jgi:hypothetical protein
MKTIFRHDTDALQRFVVRHAEPGREHPQNLYSLGNQFFVSSIYWLSDSNLGFVVSCSSSGAQTVPCLL